MLSLNKKILKNHYVDLNLKRNKELFQLKNKKINNGRLLKKLRYYKQFGNLKKVKTFSVDKSRYINYSFRKNLYNQRKIKLFYQKHSENSLEILLIRAHWAISIAEAKHFIKNDYLVFKNKNIQSGDIILAKDSLLPLIFKNILIHKKYGSKVPTYLKRSVNSIYLLEEPSQILLNRN